MQEPPVCDSNTNSYSNDNNACRSESDSNSDSVSSGDSSSDGHSTNPLLLPSRTPLSIPTSGSDAADLIDGEEVLEQPKVSRKSLHFLFADDLTCLAALVAHAVAFLARHFRRHKIEGDTFTCMCHESSVLVYFCLMVLSF